MNLPISYSKYSIYDGCPIRYAHQYVFKTPADDPLTYPLALGQLTHLFVQVYNDGIMTKNQIRNLKDDLNKLYELIKLQYPSFYNGTYQIKYIDITSKVNELIEFIKANEVVFFHAVKLFNIYADMFFAKVNQSTNISTEATFHNIVELSSELTVCFYGSIDLLFFNILQDLLKYIYVSDFKTGKSLQASYYDQLSFYVYNIKTYNIAGAKSIVDNTDDIATLSFLKDNIKPDKTHLLLFNMREGVHEKKLLSEYENEYTKYIDRLLSNVKNGIYTLHKEKDFIRPKDLFETYKDSHKMVLVENCKTTEMAKTCSYCKYAGICEYRIKK